MSNVVQNENAQGHALQPAKKNDMSTFDKIVFGAIVLGLLAVVAYQVFFCGTCYVGGGRVVG